MNPLLSHLDKLIAHIIVIGEDNGNPSHSSHARLCSGRRKLNRPAWLRTQRRNYRWSERVNRHARNQSTASRRQLTDDNDVQSAEGSFDRVDAKGDNVGLRTHDDDANDQSLAVEPGE